MFGLYEFVMLALIVGAFIHGHYTGKKDAIETGVELTLKHLEKVGLITVDPKTGEVNKA